MDHTGRSLLFVTVQPSIFSRPPNELSKSSSDALDPRSPDKHTLNRPAEGASGRRRGRSANYYASPFLGLNLIGAFLRRGWPAAAAVSAPAGS